MSSDETFQPPSSPSRLDQLTSSFATLWRWQSSFAVSAQIIHASLTGDVVGSWVVPWNIKSHTQTTISPTSSRTIQLFTIQLFTIQLSIKPNSAMAVPHKRQRKIVKDRKGRNTKTTSNVYKAKTIKPAASKHPQEAVTKIERNFGAPSVFKSFGE